MEKARLGGRKNRKYGRNKRANKNVRQSVRTSRNKAKRMAAEESKAGRRLQWSAGTDKEALRLLAMQKLPA